MKLGSFNIIQIEINGFQLLAPDTYIYDKDKGGCGPGEIGDWLVPDTMDFENVRPMCQIHDYMYEVGQTKEDKKVADRVMLWNGTVMIQDIPFEPQEMEDELLDKHRLYRNMTYYVAVSYLGNASFKENELPKIDNYLLDEIEFA